MWKAIATATLATLALSAPAFADTHLTYVDDAGNPATQLYIKDGKVRMESGGDVMLYDTAAGRFTMIDREDRSYMVMDAAAMERMSAQAGQAHQRMAPSMADMDDQMAGMSPEQRAMVEQMMGGLAANAADPSAMAAPKVEIKRLGSTQKVAGFSCNDIQMVVSGMAVSRMCVAPPESLNIPAADRATLEAMHAGIERMAAMSPGGAPPDIMPQGLALKYEPEAEFADEGEGPEMLKTISRAGLKADLFAVPAGYTQESMGDMGFE